MNFSTARCFVCFVLVMMCFAVSVRAQSPAALPQQLDGEPPAEVVDPVVQARAMQVIDRALTQYRQATSYSDEMDVRLVIESASNPMKDIETEMEQATLYFAAPNRIAMNTQMFSVYCDGKRLWVVMPTTGEYKVMTAPREIDLLALLPAKLLDNPPVHPLAWVLTQPQHTFEQLFPWIGPATRIVDEPLDARPGKRIHATVRSDALLGDQPVAMSLWFNDQSGLLEEIRIDMADVLSDLAAQTFDQGPRTEGDRIDYVIRFYRTGVNRAISDDKFVYQPTVHVRQVELLTMERNVAAAADSTALLGHPAPPISQAAVDGEPLSLKELHGDVVVLYFWATWCPPCVQGMPKMQRLADRFEDQAVHFVGISLDAPDHGDRVLTFLEDKNISFRQVHDTPGTIAENYLINSIPEVFIIDGDGIVQHVGTVGETQLAQLIERVLAGEKIVKPEDVKPLVAGVPAQAAATNVWPAGTVVPQPVQPQKLQLVAREPVTPMHSEPLRVDIDGDGELDLVFVSPDGVVIVSPRDPQQRHIAFVGLRAAKVSSPRAVTPVWIDGQLHWWAAMDHSLTQQNTMLVLALYSADGTQLLWMHRPEIDPRLSTKAMLTAADLDGDGHAELIASVGIRSGMDVVTTSVFMFDRAGSVLTQRELPGEVFAVHVLPASGEQSATIMCVTDREILRLRYAPGAVLEQETPQSPAPAEQPPTPAGPRSPRS